jgi:hypothetical protein
MIMDRTRRDGACGPIVIMVFLSFWQQRVHDHAAGSLVDAAGGP